MRIRRKQAFCLVGCVVLVVLALVGGAVAQETKPAEDPIKLLTEKTTDAKVAWTRSGRS